MKQYLLETFRYNDWANRQILEKIGELPEPAAAVRLFNHLIASQDKWMARVNSAPHEAELKWFETPLAREELAARWTESLNAWLVYLEALGESEMGTVITYTATLDGKRYSSLVRDIALQLNYHAIQHRAQIIWLLRQQGIAPPFVEYIGYTSAQE